MAAVAAIRALDRGGAAAPVWVRGSAELGRRLGDAGYQVCVWTEGQEGQVVVVELESQDALVSRRHARLFLEGETFWLQDLGSINGTFLNGRPLPSAGKGNSGQAVALPEGRARLGLGPRCALEVEVAPSPLGLRTPDWGRLSGRLTYPNLNTLCDTGAWSQRLQAAPADALLLAQFQQWYNSNKKPFDQMVEVLRGQMDLMREDYRLTLDKYATRSDKSLEAVVDVVRALAGRSPAP